jgi:hypothetical protein
MLFGSLLSTFAVLCTQQRCSRTLLQTAAAERGKHLAKFPDFSTPQGVAKTANGTAIPSADHPPIWAQPDHVVFQHENLKNAEQIGDNLEEIGQDATELALGTIMVALMGWDSFLIC